MKQAIDIEDLLGWTYRDMEADRVAAARTDGRPVLGTSWAAVDRVGVLGAVVRTSHVELLPGDCDDAALVHAAVLALDDAYYAPSAEGGEVSVLDRALIAEQGGELEKVAGDRAVLTLPDGSRVDMRTITVSVYLVLHARGGTRPDCYADIARRRGRPRADGEIAPGISFEEVMYGRAVYAVWHAALVILSAELSDRLTRWQVTGPKADEAPWLNRSGRLLEAIPREYSALDKPLKRQTKRPD